MCVKSLQLCPILCNHMDRSPPGASVLRIFSRILEQVAMPSSRGSSPPRDRTHISSVPCNGTQIPYHYYHLKSESEVVQLCPTVCNSMDLAYQAPLSMDFSRQKYWSRLPFPSPRDLPDPGIEPRSPTFQADALPSEPPRKPQNRYMYVCVCVCMYIYIYFFFLVRGQVLGAFLI